MIQFVCDGCGKVTKRDYVGDRVKQAKLYFNGKDDFLIEIALGVKGTWNAGNLCATCVKSLALLAINKERQRE